MSRYIHSLVYARTLRCASCWDGNKQHIQTSLRFELVVLEISYTVFLHVVYNTNDHPVRIPIDECANASDEHVEQAGAAPGFRSCGVQFTIAS